LALVWLALFQGLQGFWKFFVGQYYLLTGSSVATSLYPTNSMLLVVIFLGLLAALFWLGKRVLSWQYWLPLFLWALLTLKYAFSRQDAGHLQALFELLIFLGVFWTLVLPRKRWTNISLSLGVVLVFSVLCKYTVGLNRFSTTDFHPVVYLQRLLQPQHTKAQYWLKWERAKSDARGAVKLNGVAFPWNHLLSSELPPPPIPQAYAAYHPYLDGRNALYFDQLDRPNSIIIHPGAYQAVRDPLSVDDHYIWNVAPLTRNAIWKNYRPLREPSSDQTRNKLWPQREKPLPFDTIGERRDTLQFNKWFGTLDQEGSLAFISGSVKLTLWGQMQSLVKIPGLFIEYALDDGTFRRYRLNPLNWESGYLLQPYHDPLNRRKIGVDSIQVVALQSGAFQDKIPVEISTYSSTPLGKSKPLARKEIGDLKNISLDRETTFDTCLQIPTGASLLDFSLRSRKTGRNRATLTIKSGDKRETFFFNRMPAATGQLKSDYFQWRPGSTKVICLSLQNAADPIYVDQLSLGIIPE
jgi:hypothetical protein